MSSSQKINAFSIFTILVFIGSLFYAGFFLANTASVRNLTLSKEASAVADSLQTLTTSTSLYSEEYYQGINDIIASDPAIAAFIVTQDGNPSYVWPVGSSFVVADKDDNPCIESDSPLITVKNGYFVTNAGVTNYSIAFSCITSQDIYYRLSHAFIVILSATIICLLVIAYIAIFKAPLRKNAQQVKQTSSKTADSEEDSFYDSMDEDDYESEYPYAVAFKENIDDVFDEQDNEEAIHKIPEPQIPESFVVEAAKPQAAVHAAPKKRVLKESEDPLGLFSDITGFGWESYLETRLDSELIRAASSEYDLALFIVKIKDIERTNPVYSEICGVLLSFFKFRDMVFEYGTDSFAGIVTGMDINGCMSSVEQLYTSLTEIIRKNDIEGKVMIGISTRSFRLIPGYRLLHEAKDAVSKAEEMKDMPVVAFRVNPDKYKEYLEEEMAQEPIAS